MATAASAEGLIPREMEIHILYKRTAYCYKLYSKSAIAFYFMQVSNAEARLSYFRLQSQVTV